MVRFSERLRDFSSPKSRTDRHGCEYIPKHKSSFHPITGHEGPEGEYRYSSTLPSTSALDGGWMVSATPRPLYPVEDPVPIV